MAQKWNLQDIVPPDRARRSKTVAQEPARPSQPVRQAPPREMRVQQSDVRRMSTVGHSRFETRRAAVQPDYTEEQTEEYAEDFAQETNHAHSRETEDYMEQPTQVADTRYVERDPSIARIRIEDGRLARMRKFIFAGVACAIVGGIGLAVTIAMTGAEVTVKPKSYATTIQASFSAKKAPGPSELGYELLTLEEEGQRQVPASGKEDVSLKAEGEITLYNGFSTTPQKLVANTRFEAPGGMIYRISEGVTIPGYSKDSSGGVKPGSVVVKVKADGEGESYNLSDTRLTIPGLKGSEQYTSMYAEVAKPGIQGGFSGTRYVIDEDKLATTKQELHTELRDKLLARLKSERPNGFTMFDSAVTFVYDSLPAQDAGADTAVIKERARLMVPLFNEALFASFIAKSTIAGYGGEPVRIKEPVTLTFNYEGSPLTDISTLDGIVFKLDGTVKIIAKFDSSLLKNDLLGKDEDQLFTVLAKYPSIEKAKAVIRPLWKSSFPEDPESIKVTEVEEMP